MKRLIAWVCTLCMLLGCMVLPASAASTNQDKIWTYFKNQGFSDAGVAGIMGNLEAESSYLPNNLEGSANNKSGYSDASFTKAVDNGSISRSEFISSDRFGVCTSNPNGYPTGKEYGYGLAQWTYTTRKAALYDFAQKRGTSIADLNMQLDFMMQEMSSSLKSYLRTATDVSDACVKFHNIYEGSADTAAMIAGRVTKAKNVYSKYSGAPSTTYVTLNASAQSDGSILLSWNNTNWAGYWIYRSTSADGPWTTMSEQPAGSTSWRDKNPTPGTTYHYFIQPFNSNRQGQNYSNYVTAKPTGNNIYFVTLQANAQSDGSILLSWNKTDWSGYWIYRSTSADGPWTTMSEQPAESTSWRDKYPSPGTTYHYFIQPFSSNRQGQNYSNYVTATVQKVEENPSVTPTNAKVKTDKSTYEPGDTVTVTPSATGASDYSISVFCGDEKVFSNYTGFTGSISFNATKVGDYRVVVSCRNSAGYVDATCTFTVQKIEENPSVTPPATSTEIHFPRVSTYTQGQFTDVPPAQWFTANVTNAVEFGLMKGNSATTFNPYGDVTLAEAITMAARIHAIYTTGTESFDQTSGGKWYQVYLDYAYENGIIDNSYYTCDVTKKATRAQYAEIFANSLPGKGLETRNHVADNAIPDVPMSQSYADSVYKLYRAGILTGGDVLGTFSPKTYITRAESATIVARMADTDNRMSFTLT